MKTIIILMILSISSSFACSEKGVGLLRLFAAQNFDHKSMATNDQFGGHEFDVWTSCKKIKGNSRKDRIQALFDLSVQEAFKDTVLDYYFRYAEAPYNIPPKSLAEIIENDLHYEYIISSGRVNYNDHIQNVFLKLLKKEYQIEAKKLLGGAYDFTRFHTFTTVGEWDGASVYSFSYYENGFKEVIQVKISQCGGC